MRSTQAGTLRRRGVPLLIAAALLALAAPSAAAQARATVRGEVTEARTARPLQGAHVRVEGSNLGTLTDAAGRYVLPGVPAGQVSLRVRMIGFAEAERTVAVAADASQAVDFALAEEALALDGIVVTGTPGQARRREVGNSIAQLEVSQLDEPVASVDQLLQGRTTSITVNQPGSSFGGGAAIRLRGNVSLSMSNQPLIFVDGVRQSAESYPLNASQASFPHYGPGSTMSPLNDIDPSDIERIEIVKGAAATTLYGSEASAGVIQIFTKKGAVGRPVWTLQTDHGLDWVQPFGSEQRPYIGLEPWLKTAYGTTNDISVSGGVGELRYFVSGNWETGDGVLPNDHQDRLGLRLNLDLQAREDLALQFNSAFADHALSITHTGNSGMGLPLNVFRQPNNSFGSDDPEVLSELLDAEIHQDNHRFTAGFSGTWTPWEGVSQKFTVGLDQISTRGTQLRPLGFQLDPRGSISDIRWESSTLTADYSGSLEWLDRPSLASTFSWGAQSIATEESKVDGYGTGFPGPGEHTLSSTAERFLFGSESRIVTAGMFFQNLVGWRDRLFLTVGARVDGSSTFGEELGLQVYPKASASYVVSDEPFWGEGWGQVKLRAAFGYAGRAPGAFDAVRTWTPQSFGGTSAFVPGNVGNPNLGPEKTREVELGLDGSWLQDRLRVEATWYDQRTTDALFSVAQIPSFGFVGSQLENVGEIANHGLELGVTGTLLRARDYGLTLGGTVATNRSEVREVGSATDYNIQEGQPAPVVRGTRVANADEYAEPVLELDHFFGPNQPTLMLGLNADVDLPLGVRLAARGEYQGGHFIADQASQAMVDRGFGAPGCDDAYELVPFPDYAASDVSGLTALQRARCYRQNLRAGMWIYPADFFKLREVTLSVPVAGLIPGTRSATASVSVRNVFRWTHEDFLAFDPEMVSSRETTRALTSGITEHAPAPARFVASLRVSF